MKNDNRHHHDEKLDVSSIDNPDVRHEGSDLRVKPIALFLFWLLFVPDKDADRLQVGGPKLRGRAEREDG